ncbi:hypothetical protein BD779DRAFT_854212 [Infundibulicybe gibba]|nr:hypothetical protein BD779DRAFT_854212 [Infundibulicybe gibba]
MNGVEAAASLFGSEDLATDPFSNLGENTSTHSTGDDLFGTQTTSSSALGDNAEEQNFFSSETETKDFHDDGAPVTNYSYSDTYGGQAPTTEGGSWDAGPAQSSGDPYAYTPATTHNYLPPAIIRRIRLLRIFMEDKPRLYRQKPIPSPIMTPMHRSHHIMQPHLQCSIHTRPQRHIHPRLPRTAVLLIPQPIPDLQHKPIQHYPLHL